MPCKLNIIEPWKFGTEKSVDAEIMAHNGSQFIIHVLKELVLDGNPYSYLLAEFREKDEINRRELLGNHPVYPVNMVFSKEVLPGKMKELNISNFRGNFLLGSVIFE